MNTTTPQHNSPEPLTNSRWDVENDDGWMFRCDKCGAETHCTATSRFLAIETMKSVGWRFIELNDFCPECVFPV